MSLLLKRSVSPSTDTCHISREMLMWLVLPGNFCKHLFNGLPSSHHELQSSFKQLYVPTALEFNTLKISRCNGAGLKTLCSSSFRISQHYHGQTGRHVQPIMLGFRASFSKSSQMRYITNNQKWICFELWAVSCTPCIPLSTYSIPMVTLPKILWNQWADSH